MVTKMEICLKSEQDIRKQIDINFYKQLRTKEYVDKKGATFTNFMFNLCGQIFPARKAGEDSKHLYDYEITTKWGNFLIKKDWIQRGSND